MWRPRSDIKRLQFRDTLLRYSQENHSISSVVLHIQEPKEAQQKSTQLGLLDDAQQIELCVIRCLEKFIQGTMAFCSCLPQYHTLLLSNLNKPNEIQPTNIAPKTVAAWVKTHILKAGINQDYSAHPIRAASSTKTVQRGVYITNVKEHDNWSQESNTFERYYYKPVGQVYNSSKIQNSIFSQPENCTASESEAKATWIIVGTTHNTNVAEASDKEVVQTQPWFIRWFS